MWFKRKPKNRRLGREHVLDVKLRSSQVRAARARLIAVSLGGLFTVMGATYLLWRASLWSLDELVYQNKEFAIQDLDIQTDGVIAPDQLRRWAGVRPGQNLLALDLAMVKRNLDLVSAIRSVSLQRVPPHTLRIRVTEREPLAQINLPAPNPAGGLQISVFYLDGDGYVILPLESQQRAAPAAPPEPLPVVAGLNGNEVQAGRRIESLQVKAALQLLRAFERSPMEGLVDLKRLDVSSPEVLVATTGQGSEVTFGRVDLDLQLNRWHAIYEEGLKSGKALATLDLAVTNNIPARWLEANAIPAELPRSPKTLHKKKRHV